MEQGKAAIIEVGPLPESALGAAAAFHAEWSETVRNAIGSGVEYCIIVMQPAPYDHADWRRATARDLARAFPDHCVTIVAGMEGPALSQTLDYLVRAPGVTGQYIVVAQDEVCDDAGA